MDTMGYESATISKYIGCADIQKVLLHNPQLGSGEPMYLSSSSYENEKTAPSDPSYSENWLQNQADVIDANRTNSSNKNGKDLLMNTHQLYSGPLRSRVRADNQVYAGITANLVKHGTREHVKIRHRERNRILSELSKFRFVKEDWNGPGSVGPSKQVIEIALEFILNWPVESIVPEPEMYSNGAISWQFYDEGGYTIGGVEFHDNDVGVFSIVNRTKVIDSGCFKSNSINELLGIVGKLEVAFLNGKEA